VKSTFPGGASTAYRGGYIASTAAKKNWYGSLTEDQTDASGLQYKRNRYYDPRSGQFTQEDPIGLAGGMNLYGYANGDPVNYSDPFGLCGQSAGSDTTKVEICTAKADLPGNVFDVQHEWFRIGGEEFGLGVAGAGVPGEGPYVYKDNIPFLTPAEVTDHTGRSSRAGASCQALPNVSASCVRDKMPLGSFRGPFQPVPGGNNCQTAARTVISQCSMPLKVKPDATRVVPH
jgi:RHS repeat-associated protein